jgi:hypothetical protein
LKQELSKKTFKEWVDESGDLAFKVAYDSLNLIPGTTITPEYEQAARELIDHQLALGGYRLADALSSMLKSEPVSILSVLLKQK